LTLLLNFPLFLINLKCYEEALGEGAIKIALSAKKVSHEYGIDIAISPVHTDLASISRYGIKTFAQAADPVDPGSHTGHVPLEAIKIAGAIGVIINHSEKKLSIDAISFLLNKCRKLNLISLVCGASVEECVKIASLKPDIIAIEPPELIGTGRSVSKYRPESVYRTVKEVKSIDKSIKVLCGAGITDGDDVKEALRLGAEGILVASSIVKAKDQEMKIRELAMSMRRS